MCVHICMWSPASNATRGVENGIERKGMLLRERILGGPAKMGNFRLE